MSQDTPEQTRIRGKVAAVLKRLVELRGAPMEERAPLFAENRDLLREWEAEKRRIARGLAVSANGASGPSCPPTRTGSGSTNGSR